MATFKDTAGQEYSTKITVATYLKLKAKGIDLNDLIRGDLLQRLTDDVGLMIETLCIVAAPKDADEFLSSMDGETLETAVNSLLDGFVDFFPQAKQPALRRLLEKGREVERLVGEKMTAAAEAVTTDSILASMHLDSRESSVSTPGDTVSES